MCAGNKEEKQSNPSGQKVKKYVGRWTESGSHDSCKPVISTTAAYKTL